MMRPIVGLLLVLAAITDVATLLEFDVVAHWRAALIVLAFMAANFAAAGHFLGVWRIR